MKDGCWLRRTVRRGRRKGEDGAEPSGVIGSWTANLSQLNQQQQR